MLLFYPDPLLSLIILKFFDNVAPLFCRCSFLFFSRCYSSVHTLLPYDYYSLNFCKPADGVKPYSENLGEFLRGDRIENSAYAITMLEEKYCKVLCQTEFTQEDVTAFTSAIAQQYHHNWIIDNLPAASILDTDQFVTTQYVGFPIGYTDGPTSFLYNHVNIILEYHEVEGEGYRCGD